MSEINWSVNDGVYRPANKVSPDLPAGLYEVGADMSGLWYREVVLATDTLYLLPRTATGEIMGELETFWNQQAQFEKYGILHKRGILLYGPQGTGKTSILNLVSQEAIKRGAICFRYSSAVAAALEVMRKSQPDMPAVVFIEDIDEYADHTDLLNLLDGSAQVNNVIYVATTNYPQHLPQRLVNRPSRFDRRILIGYPEAEARRIYFERVSKDDGEDYSEWVRKSEGLSFAHLKELFIAVRILGNDFDKAVENLRGMSEKISSLDWGDDPDENDTEDLWDMSRGDFKKEIRKTFNNILLQNAEIPLQVDSTYEEEENESDGDFVVT